MSIVSHGQANLVMALLRSLDEFVVCERHDVSIIITENTTSRVKHTCKYPTQHIYNLRRKGFGANHNSAFEKIDPDFFLVVNPDIIFQSEFNLDRLTEAMLSSEIDLTSPIITNAKGEAVDYKRADLTLASILRRKLFKENLQYFDWYAGMFLVFTGKCYRDLGGFDPRFFMYVEDCDICVRATSIGYKINDVVDMSVRHDARRASKRIGSIYFYWHVSSLFKYWLKRISKWVFRHANN